MPRFRELLVVLAWAAAPSGAVGLPDTGVDTCYNATAADTLPAAHVESVAADNGTHPRQDCRYGRDAAAYMGLLAKTGAGPKGLDYTKITNAGAATDPAAALGTGASDWACTRDNTTGLTWEVKSPTAGNLRHAGSTFTWFSSDAGSNGGNAGVVGTSTCGGSLPSCNTQDFIAAVNAAALCSYTDWRLPTPRELITLHYEGFQANVAATLEATYFPSSPSVMWTATTYAFDAASAWVGSPVVGLSVLDVRAKTTAVGVRLVRGTVF